MPEPGVYAASLSPISRFGTPEFLLEQDTVAGTLSYDIGKDLGFAYKVIDVRGYMIGAGSGTQSVALHDSGSNVIMTAVDVSSHADKAVIIPALIDDAYVEISKSEWLKVVTVDDALVRLHVRCVKV